jgi:hypothetical protein
LSSTSKPIAMHAFLNVSCSMPSISANVHRMWHLWRNLAAFTNNNIHLMSGVHNTCDQWQSLSCALSITLTSNSTPITEGIDRM